ncbi:4-(cytidine 5'-diphospho)-2-C-methyl-D-erythritol kinase [bacterium]|nr:4-(cytidine 5'-diphospho)-2-C-methyl-D-erythritol kinase [candidate division CSSED10-310 bacterium]
MMTVKSYAKVNLLLEILGKRQDGFHELYSLMQTISLHDLMHFQRSDDNLISFHCVDDAAGRGPDNLVYKAAELFFNTTGITGGVRIDLDKHIPVGAGLGGGSSNAAMTLKVLNIMFDQPLNRYQLYRLAAKLGSDVPFFIEGGTAIASGRGDLISPLPFIGKLLMLLINPGVFVSTARVYSNLNLLLTSPKCLHNILPVLSTGRITEQNLAGLIRNDLQDAVLRLFPEIQSLVDWLSGHGAAAACVSGSGGTVFGLFLDRDTADKVLIEARREFYWACLTSSVEGTYWNTVSD